MILRLKKTKFFYIFLLFFCFVFIFSFSSSVYALNEPITYTVSCVNYSPITVSSDGNIISGLEQIPEIHKLAFADKLKEYIRQWETMNTEQQRVALSLISQYYGFTCTIKNNEANTEVSAESLFTPVVTPPIVFTPEVGFPGFSGPITVDGFLFGKFIFALFTYSIYLSGVLAVIFVSIAGFKWVSAGGNQSKITEAKNQLINSITGMFLVFATFLILSTINEDLVIMKEIKTDIIDPVGFEDAPGVSGNNSCVPASDIVSVSIGNGRSVQVHKRVADEVEMIFNEIAAAGISVREVGGFRGLSSNFSCVNSKHAKGLAIDIDPTQNMYYKCGEGSKKILLGRGGSSVICNSAVVVGSSWKPSHSAYQNKWVTINGQNNLNYEPLSINPDGVAQIFKNHGWCWGGDWNSAKDYMHFSKSIPGDPELGYSECK